MTSIAEAVDDKEWQKFRRSMKGETTERKLEMLKCYWAGYYHPALDRFADEKNKIDTRVDNYIKALCRGGQLYAGESLETVRAKKWKPRIRKAK